MGLNAQKAQAVIEIQGKDSISDLIQQVGGKLDGLGQKTVAQRGAIDEVRASWAAVATGVHSVLGIAGQVYGAVSEIFDAAREFAEEQALEVAFRRAIPAADELMSKIDKLTGEQIRDDVIQKFAAQMARAGISADQIAESFELATKASNATGQSLEGTIKAFADGVTKANDRGLKGLGINIDLKTAMEAQAKHLGVSVDKLTLAEQRTVLLRASAQGLRKDFGDVDIEGTLIARLNHADRVLDQFKDKLKGVAADILDTFSSDAWSNAITALIPKEAIQQAKDRAASARLKAQFDFPALAEAQRAGAAMVATLKDQEVAARALAEANSTLTGEYRGKLTPNIYEANAALKVQEIQALLTAQALGLVMAASGDPKALEQFKKVKEAADELAGKAKPKGGGGGGSAAPKEWEWAEASRRQKETIANRDRDWAASVAEREIQAIFADGERKLAAFNAQTEKEKAALVARDEAKRSLEDMLEKESASSFTGAAAALKSSSEIYLQGIGAFADSLHSEMGRITDIMALVEKSGGTMGDAWAKSAPGMVSAIGQVGAAFTKDAKVKYTILSLAEAGASIASFATLDFMGGALHAAAAVQYGLAASMAGGSGASAGARGGGGRGASSAKPGQIGGSTPAPQQSSPTIVLNFGGATIYGGNRESVARELSGDINKHVSRYQSAAKPHQWVP